MREIPSMQTVDSHTHLLNPEVRFNRLFDRISVMFFAEKLGMDREKLHTEPFAAYVTAMAHAIRQSRYVKKACLFGVDARVNEQGKQLGRDRTVCATTQDVLRVCAGFPELFIPFLSINPLRPDALDLLDQYVEQGCHGAKFLQNYWRIDLNDERFIPYYEKLKFHKLPLIVHIGSEYTIDSERRYEGVAMLDLPLACGVTVVAAHMGLGRIKHKLLVWKNLTRNPRDFDDDYFILLQKLKTHANLYADISAILVPMRARALTHLAAQRDVHEKILFGTDYPVPFTTTLNSYDLSWAIRRRISAIDNPFDRYTSAILEYFPEHNPIYQNYRKLLPDSVCGTAD